MPLLGRSDRGDGGRVMSKPGITRTELIQRRISEVPLLQRVVAGEVTTTLGQVLSPDLLRRIAEEADGEVRRMENLDEREWLRLKSENSSLRMEVERLREMLSDGGGSEPSAEGDSGRDSDNRVRR